MDLNLVVLAGRLAAAPEVRTFEGGSSLVRYLVTTRSERPRRRIDVIPVVLWDADETSTTMARGDRIWVAGAVQRRFWSDDHNRRSRVEVVAFHVQRSTETEKDGTADVRTMVEESAKV